VFRAERDGEYWFMVRTQDAQGRILPDRPNEPELKVLVDTAQPLLELTASRSESGEITARWQASDPNLRPLEFRLEYQTAGTVELPREVPVEPARGEISGGQYSGQVTWFPQPAAASLIVRAEIADSAGNRTVTQTHVGPRVGDRAAARRDRPEISGNSAAESTNIVSMPAPSGTRWPADRVTQAPLGREQAPVVDDRVKRLVGDDLPKRHFGDDLARRPVAEGALAIKRLPQVGPSVQPASTGAPGLNSSQPGGSAAAGRTATAFSRSETWLQPPLRDVQPGVNGTGPLAGNAASNRDTGLGNRSAMAATGTPPTTPLTLDRLPAGERVRMVNARSFQLEYDVESVGPWGIRRVELWGTRDGGQSWTSYGIDADNRSPLAAHIDGEGLYGFRIVVQAGNGMVEPAPRPGDRPEIWVLVDQTRPVCRITHCQQGAGDRVAEMTIGWEASDARLAERPVTLLFSEQPAGPWSTIAAGLENTGRYVWQLDGRVPDRIYLRLEVRDAAGNVEASQLNTPVLLDRLRPRGRIRDVRP
jgi:hypothetical protein